jgi:hypothetical protein
VVSNTPIPRKARITGCWMGVQAVRRAGSIRAVRSLRALSGNDCTRNTTMIPWIASSTQRTRPAGVSVPRSGNSATSARLIGSRNVREWKKRWSRGVSTPRNRTYSVSASSAIAKIKRERLKRQPRSSAAATTVNGKTVAKVDAVPLSAGRVSSKNAPMRIGTSGTSLEKRRFIGPVTVRFLGDWS